MPHQSKRFKALAAKAPPTSEAMAVDKAVGLLKQFNTTKFDQSVEVAMRLGIDAKQADQLVRGSIVLPNGIGKSLRVVVVAKTVKEYKAGKVEFRNDSGGVVHAVVGKLSFDAPKLVENIQAFINHIHG